MTTGGEYLEADGLGGFASGTASGVRTRRYHALLLHAHPDGRRFVLVNGVDAFLDGPAGSWPLSTQVYAGGAIQPDGQPWLAAFVAHPWPAWRHRFPDGSEVLFELVARHRHPQVLLRWQLVTAGAAPGAVTLRVRPLLSGRDYHGLQRENRTFAFEPAGGGGAGDDGAGRLRFRPYPGVPDVVVASNGRYRHQPYWYRWFHYADEAARGLDCEEDLASPGELSFDLHAGPAHLVLAAGALDAGAAQDLATRVWDDERARRARFASPEARAADAYIVEPAAAAAAPAAAAGVTGGARRAIVAGYPWFTEWGRDTFIALRGLCLATGRLDDAGAVLARWLPLLDDGLVPNRAPEGAVPPAYNAADASLWFVVAAFEYLEAARVAGAAADDQPLRAAVEAILAAHAAGTRHGIALAPDGLLAAGEPGLQLTWMDARIDDQVVTPRTGKPVEVQALWLNALWIGGRMELPSAARWRALFAQGRAAFGVRFWNPAAGHLHDVVDVDHHPGTHDPRLRPNQILAVGGLPLALLAGPQARAVVDAVEARLYTPLGLRTLDPRDPDYHPRFEGDMRARDAAYHQGAAWPWLLGPFVEAWVRVRSSTPEARREARGRFLPPLEALRAAGHGHLPELADGDPPQRPGGCPCQAWSLGELLRLERLVLG
jgi:predicted glycogen debranching enzyme